MRIYTFALLLSAGLLFCLQPMIGKILLSMFGGAPAVWNACMLFFQALLLAGYLYAHVTVTWLGVKRQAIVHVVLVLLPWLVLPIAVHAPSEVDLDTAPVQTLLALLLRSVGLPFFVLSTTAPLLQRWFSSLGHPSGKDPYFLYAASNFGSILALLGYPVLIEPLWGIRTQSLAWSIGYGVFVAVVAACALAVWRAPSAAEVTVAAAPEPSPTLRVRARWLVLSFVPSSLLMGVTQHITTDIAAIPLFWVLPLALYLVTFMLVFARNAPIPHRWMVRVLPLFATLTLLFLAGEATEPRWPLVAVHLGMCFVAWMVCHGELVAARPPAVHLTEFYLWMSLGGVLGGAFNGLLAPLVSPTIVEYPLAIVVACFCRPFSGTNEPGDERRDWLVPLAVGAIAVALALVARARLVPVEFKYLVAAPLFLNYRSLMRPTRFAAGLGAVLAATTLYPGMQGAIVSRERNFFGVVRVTKDPTGTFLQILHGNTIHGRQSIDPARRAEPLTYYHPTGPAGDIFEQASASFPRARVGIIGLGAGALAHYARKDDDWTFYEINPAVVRMAKESFTYLADAAPGPSGMHIVLGDARLRLREAPAHGFDVLVLDAFSSDAIPAHLLTRESLHLYLEKLQDRGLVAMHVSNRYIDLLPPIARLVADAGLVFRARHDFDLSDEMLARGKTGSSWVVLARDVAALGKLGRDPRWETPPLPRGGAVWTDDYSNLVTALRW